MALNVAVPLSGCDDLLNEFNLLSPILPINIDSRDKLKILCSPIGSESSGVSSLDSEEIKKSSTSSSPVEERGSSVSSTESTNAVGDENATSNEDDEIANDENEKSHLTGLDNSTPKLASPMPKHPEQVEEILADTIDAELNISAGDSDAEKNDIKTDEYDEDYYSIEKQKKMIPKTNYMWKGRNILNLGANISSSGNIIQYTELPESNLNLFLANRSQYHRLGDRGHIQEYALTKCTCCDFIYPVNGYNNNTNSNDNVNVNAYEKQDGGLAAAILAGVRQIESLFPPMASPQNNHNQHYQQKNQMAQQHTVAHPPTINELLNTNYQQQQQMATIAALLSATNKDNTLNSTYGNGTINNNNNIANSLNRFFGHNNTNNNGNWDNINHTILTNNNYNSNGAVQTKNYHHYSANQVVPPSNYGYYKQF